MMIISSCGSAIITLDEVLEIYSKKSAKK